MGIYAERALLEQKSDQAFIQAVNEVYFGRTSGINRCFNAFCDFREKYTDDSFLRGIKHIDVDHDKDLKRFCEEMERQFGFESFSFIVRNTLEVNMMTIPIAFWQNGVPSKHDIKNWVYMDKEGYHFNKDARASCIIISYAQMLFDTNLSNEEAFSIVMHEVGHNFQAFLNGDMINMSFVRSIILVYSLILDIFINLYYMNPTGIITDIETIVLSAQGTHRGLSKLFNRLTEDTTRNNLYSYFNFISGILKVPRNIATAVIMLPLAPILGLVSGAMSLFSSFSSLIGLFSHTYGYAGEQMADNFPTYYGFGVSRVSSELKSPSPFGPLVEGAGKIPVIGHIYNFLLMPAQMLIDIGDVHPGTSTRCKSVINSMKTDLNDTSLSPKLRAQLAKEISSAEKEMDDYFKKASDVKDPEALKVFYDKCIYASANGGFKYRTFRSIFNLDKGVQQMSPSLKESASISDTKII